ncbi:IS630 family transposase [Belnapia sp. T6]|uniref:IS630 family transposase n=1 Tax=Belnapia mucosa TaxID=2804532 RepID=A0ABS1VCK6_9PROT|nr:IS630 family transposase [Belnapia mucosa]
MGGAGAGGGFGGARATRRGPSLGTDRGACGTDPGSCRPKVQHNAEGDPGRVGQSWCVRWHRHALALLRPAPDDVEKNSAHAAEQDRPDVLRRRWAWFEAQPDLDPDRLVFVDENWTSTNMARTHGWAPQGQRLRAAIPHGHWLTTTFVAGLRNTGMVAPMVLDGPINGSLFQDYVEQALVLELRPSDIVVMDNLGSHKGASVRAAIEAAGASPLYLPRYSPDFNSIEQAFAELKAIQRSCLRSQQIGGTMESGH